eukprot:15028557-Alexandrium_andersonii.AAC.1
MEARQLEQRRNKGALVSQRGRRLRACFLPTCWGEARTQSEGGDWATLRRAPLPPSRINKRMAGATEA